MMSNLNIAVATAPETNLNVNIKKDMDLIKTGLLYGDKIKLFSLTSPLVMFMYLSGDFDQDMKDEILQGILSSMGDEYAAVISVINALKRKKHRTSDELKALMNAKRAFRTGSDEIFGKLTELAKETGVENLLPAFERDLIILEEENSWDFSSNDYIEQYIEKIVHETFSGNSFPMYDKQISHIIHLFLKEQGESISEVRQQQIKHIASVHNALSALPDFANATIQETIDIREELEIYLANFRAAMLSYSQKIKSMPWDKDFDNEVSLLFLAEVAPKVDEIRSIVEQNSFVRKLCTNLFNDKAVTLTGVAGLGAAVLPLAQAIKLPTALVAGASVVGTIGKNIMNTYNDYLLSSKRAEENAFFFYYKAGLLL